ncbi:MAG TPA: S8 family peptidase, partial [Saprospiraceae bacterium]|nr:S8 family peptidase [Saprospiraceae bacterium]
TVHFWNTRLTVYGGGNWGYGFTAPAAGYVLGDKNYGIGHPGVTNSVITAAAHETNYLIAYFSSYGPRMDDVLKPDISAPGLDIISSFNSFAVENPTPDASVDFNGKSYEFIKLSGTSMSAPMITGAVALLLEADPTLSSADVKELVINSARTDASTGSIGPEGNVRWGYGKLDVYAAMQDIFFTGIESYTQAEHYVIPNPAHDRIYISGQMQGNETYRLVSLDGQEKSRGQLKGSVYVGDVPAGMYLLNVESGKKVESFRVVINR